MINEKYAACEAYSAWLLDTLVATARGETVTKSANPPAARFWLGRLAPEAKVLELDMGDRGERLEPCAAGFRVLVPKGQRQTVVLTIRAVIWRLEDQEWSKLELPLIEIPFELNGDPQETSVGFSECAGHWHSDQRLVDYRASVDITVADRGHPDAMEARFELVNRSDYDKDDYSVDTNLYETELSASGLKTIPFKLDNLPDSFRYEREVSAYGINCGVSVEANGKLRTVDVMPVNQRRPVFWNSEEEQPDLSFERLSKAPYDELDRLAKAYTRWFDKTWSAERLKDKAKADNWSEDMLGTALRDRELAIEERERLLQGIRIISADEKVSKAFKCMNASMNVLSKRKDYKAWRPFQLAFILCNANCFVNHDDESDIADLVWFATGGGKTETYLGMIIMAAFVDRLEGKHTGLTAWSRFPLRMLSLQQTQRFADAFAAAEMVRVQENIEGDGFSVGFLVGGGATPNRIKEEAGPGEPDVEDDSMPERYKVLSNCPFCGNDSITMRFNRALWRLEHRCSEPHCEKAGQELPFYVVDEEIYRYLPTVVVGTLDKAATISMQAAMRGLVGPPHGKCKRAGHGFTYAIRKNRPTGCLVPGCTAGSVSAPDISYAPRLRLQDELHLLKDSLGAVDSHYEALYDGLSYELSGRKPKILASSATLSGFEKQVAVLYRRRARVFPVPPPSEAEGFWSSKTGPLMRRYAPLAPRGITLEYMLDNTITILQRCLRSTVENPQAVADELGITPDLMPFLVSMYGTDVIYGNTLRDLDAAQRSLETQVRVEGALNQESLTGRRGFEEIRSVLRQLEEPKEDFYERVHAVTASSMMSHGVDINRLNIMAMLGLPLTTSEFIQATARVGRTWPGLVLVAFKIGRERDAAMYRLFEKYIEHGDRFVEAIPITKRSRRVLERTLPGLLFSRILMIHEESAGESLFLINKLKTFMKTGKMPQEEESKKIIEYLGLTTSLDESMRRDVMEWVELFFRNLEQPSAGVNAAVDCCPRNRKPMLSLRDVEEQVPIHLPVSR